MNKSDQNQSAKTTHSRVQSSTTLNRKYVKRPTTMDIAAAPHPIQTSARLRMKQRTAPQPAAKRLTAVELKNQAIAKALAAAPPSASSPATQPTTPAATQPNTSPAQSKVSNTSKKPKSKKHKKSTFGPARIALAFACTAAAVFAIVYFVNLNMPDVSLKVTAIQTGIEASYPSYVPRDFTLSDITSEEGKITLNFTNSSTGDAFTLTEETSSWDSEALLANYVKTEYGDNYTTIREQGLTIYINNSNACWVNGGIVYKIKTTSGSLTKKQIKSIAVSL